MDHPPSAAGSAAYEPLLQLATPELYERNAFRLLELPVQASERELARRREVMERAAANRLPTPPGPARVLPREPAPDEHEVREAGHALLDAERRLAHEFFWFWPLRAEEARDDAALARLAAGDADAAAALWQQDGGAVARHNLAVLGHLQVLALERALAEDGAATSASLVARAGRLWADVDAHWRAAAGDEALWDRLLARIRAIDDASLKTGAARRLRQALPGALALVLARTALRALERGRPDDAQRLARGLHAAGAEAGATDEGLRRAIEPLRALLKSLRETAERAAEADEATADRAAEQLLDRAAAPLAGIDLLLPEAHPARGAEHDLLAQRALACQVTFGNRTGRHARSLELLDRITGLAASAGVKERLARERRTVAENLEGSLCWSCGCNPGDEALAVPVPMHGDVQREATSEGLRTTWRHLTIKVPRCRQCVEEDALFAKAGGWALGAFNLSLVAAIASHAGFDREMPTPALVLLAGLLAALALVRRDRRRLGARCRPDVPRRRRDDYPAIVEFKAKGWQFGERPAEG